MEDSLEGEEMEAEKEKSDSDEYNGTTKDSEPMEAEVVPPPRPSPPSAYISILRRAGKTCQIARKTTLNHRGIQKHSHGLSESMSWSLRDPNWIVAFAEDRISSRRITTQYEDGQSSGVYPPPGD